MEENGGIKGVFVVICLNRKIGKGGLIFLTAVTTLLREKTEQLYCHGVHWCLSLTY